MRVPLYFPAHCYGTTAIFILLFPLLHGLFTWRVCCAELDLLPYGCTNTERLVKKRNVEVRVHASAGPAVRAESAVSVSFRQVCSFLMGFGLHVTGNVNKTPVVDAEVAAQSERKAQQEYFAYNDLRSGKL